MGSESTRRDGDFVGQLANHARRLQREARDALARGDFTRASALIGDAELLAEDVHGMVGDMERRELGELAMLAAYDVRGAAEPAACPALAAPSRRMRIAMAATLAMSFVLVEC
ncbi:hypothetical protein [Erythrobacter donghaensis]|jgi:hypothetical protein|uniref:hypothetical protein n=1 Tax=Erythrobacter donghaensis TaxID=267135 RepID=UPI0009389F2B|nr:hypothetical protein [Erythrobacter donghaensis]